MYGIKTSIDDDIKKYALLVIFLVERNEVTDAFILKAVSVWTIWSTIWTINCDTSRSSGDILVSVVVNISQIIIGMMGRKFGIPLVSYGLSAKCTLRESFKTHLRRISFSLELRKRLVSIGMMLCSLQVDKVLSTHLWRVTVSGSFKGPARMA